MDTRRKVSIPRLHSVRFKDGGATVRVIRRDTPGDRAYVERNVNEFLDGHIATEHGIVGFAFIVWDERGDSFSVSATRDHVVPRRLVPDLARAELVSASIKSWVERNYGDSVRD